MTASATAPLPRVSFPLGTTSRMWTSRVIGALFLAGFLAYGTGAALVNSVVGDTGFLGDIDTQRTVLALGAFLMIATAAVDIGKAVFFFPVLERHGKRTAVAYLATMIFEMALMTVGVLALLMILPLAEHAGDGGLDHETAQVLGTLAVEANEIAYQVGQLSLAFGALFMVALLLRTGLVPRWLAILGLVGYALHMTGSAAEIFGAPISLVLLIPGGLFEVTLAIWLLVKGFAPAPYDGPSMIPTTAGRRP